MMHNNYYSMDSSASAFVPNALPAGRASVRTNTVMMGLSDMPGSSAPFKNFDPLGLAAKATPEKLNYYRASELKHGRVSGDSSGLFVSYTSVAAL